MKTEEEKGMSFNDALKILNIEDYAKRIYNSNSHGELFHLYQYIQIAKVIANPKWFREWFIDVVEQAEKTWDRPESVFQHIATILQDHIKQINT